MAIRRNPKGLSDTDLNALLALFEAKTEVKDGTTIEFKTFDHGVIESVLADGFEADPAFTARQKRYLIRQALWNSRKAGPLTIKNLEAEAARLAKAHLAQPRHRYTLWTKFRARNMGQSPSFRLSWDGVRIESSNGLPAHLAQEPYLLSGHGDIEPSRPAFYGHLIARCDERHEENAATRMLEAIELIMAIYNMYDRFGRYSRGSGRRAEGPLWNGPTQFVFRGKTFLRDHIWYAPDFDEDHWTTFAPDMPKVLKGVPRVRRALKALAHHPMSTLLIKILRLLQNGMASRDDSYALLRYWSALEHLYGEPNSKTKNYPDIIARATFADKDKTLSLALLRHIARLRNEYVHVGDHDDDLNDMGQFLRNLISRHVNYLLFHAPDIRTHRQWLEIVDLPGDEATLTRRKGLIDRRIAIMRKRSAAEEES